MSNPIFEDKRASDLLTLVSDDVSSLREDVKMLVRHTAKRTLPKVGRNLAESGRQSLSVGRDYAAGQFQRLGRSVHDHPVGFSISGALVLGVVAAGVWFLIDSECRKKRELEANAAELDDPGTELDVVI